MTSLYLSDKSRFFLKRKEKKIHMHKIRNIENGKTINFIIKYVNTSHDKGVKETVLASKSPLKF